MLGLLAGCAHFDSRPLAPGETAARFEQRTLDNPGLKTFLEKNLNHELSSWPARSWNFEMLTLAALYYHPSLDVARAQWAVAAAGVQTAGARPNPTIGFSPQYVFNSESGVAPWVATLNFDIPIETAGKRGYRLAQAKQLSESARLNIASAAWQVRSNVRARLLDFTAARQRADLLQKQLQVQQRIVALLEQRLQASAVSRSDLTLPRVALAKAEAEFADATRRTIEARVTIAESLGLSAKAVAGVEFGFELPLGADAGKDLTSAEARQQALRGRADILAALAEYAASQTALQLEIAKQYPDIHLNTGYEYDQGLQKWGLLGLGAELPLLNRNQGPIAEAKARREESAARFMALQAKIIADIDRVLAAREAVLDQVARQHQLTQLAREQVATTEAMLKAGAADNLEVAGAQVEASVNDLVFLDAQTKLQQALGALEDAMQRPLDVATAPPPAVFNSSRKTRQPDKPEEIKP